MPFQPGQSGNPDGRRKEDSHVRALARQYTEAAVKTLADIMIDAEAPHAARATAANSLLDRGWGKPVQEISGEGGGPVKIYVGTGIDRE
jgi:hypothetical protein